MTVTVAAWLTIATLLYPFEYVKRMVLWRESSVSDYVDNFPHRRLEASEDPRVLIEAGGADTRIRFLLEEAIDVDDVDEFLSSSGTQALIVIHDDEIIFEAYANGWERDSLLTSFSVAKSFVSTLVGIAIEEGHIGGLDDPITRYLPELADRDERFAAITLRHLLTMSSGLAFSENGWFLFNGDDPLTTYHPDQRRLALEHPDIERPPGEVFDYNKYHPQLLGLILERTTGQSVTEYTQTRLWDPLGMEFDGSWSLDSEASGFEKMEAGLNARAIDYAKLGLLFLHGGRWNGEQVVSSSWVSLASGADPEGRAPAWSDDRFYGLMWWGWERDDGSIDYSAIGDHGQFVFVSPTNDIVIVRNGTDAGLSYERWGEAFIAVADQLGRP